MNHTRLAAVITAAVLAAGGLGAGLALAIGGTAQQAPRPASTAGQPSYSWYRSMMEGRYGMMGGPGSGWMMGEQGYRWMTGGPGAPGWMRSGNLPRFMMAPGHDPGRTMGRLWADTPGPRVSEDTAARLGKKVPAGAAVDRPAHRIAFAGPQATLTMVADAPGTRMYSFQTAGMVNPDITVPAGTRVHIQFINADGDMAHGVVITRDATVSSWMPMRTAAPAFTGSALWFLGQATSAGLHSGTLTFTASKPGTYQYLCAVPGHAARGMTGAFTVTAHP